MCHKTSTQPQNNFCFTGQRYTTYEVLIAKKGKVQSGEEKCWTVSKRYSDFVALRYLKDGLFLTIVPHPSVCNYSHPFIAHFTSGRDSLRGMYIEVDSFDFPNKVIM